MEGREATAPLNAGSRAAHSVLADIVAHHQPAASFLPLVENDHDYTLHCDNPSTHALTHDMLPNRACTTAAAADGCKQLQIGTAADPPPPACDSGRGAAWLLLANATGYATVLIPASFHLIPRPLHHPRPLPSPPPAQYGPSSPAGRAATGTPLHGCQLCLLVCGYNHTQVTHIQTVRRGPAKDVHACSAHRRPLYLTGALKLRHVGHVFSGFATIASHSCFVIPSTSFALARP